MPGLDFNPNTVKMVNDRGRSFRPNARTLYGGYPTPTPATNIGYGPPKPSVPPQQTGSGPGIIDVPESIFGPPYTGNPGIPDAGLVPLPSPGFGSPPQNGGSRGTIDDIVNRYVAGVNFRPPTPSPPQNSPPVPMPATPAAPGVPGPTGKGTFLPSPNAPRRVTLDEYLNEGLRGGEGWQTMLGIGQRTPSGGYLAQPIRQPDLYEMGQTFVPGLGFIGGGTPLSSQTIQDNIRRPMGKA